MVGLVRHRQTKAGTARRDLPSGGQRSTLLHSYALTTARCASIIKTSRPRASQMFPRSAAGG